MILAGGLGTRMRAKTAGDDLTPEQSNIAAIGAKVLMPLIEGRTLLELMLENLSAAGFSDLCIVVGSRDNAVRDFCAVRNLQISFAVQDKPLGTADAVLAAEDFVGDDDLFLVVNSDNLYPVASLRRLREQNTQAILAFDQKSLIEQSNIPRERIARFATLEIGRTGHLTKVMEKSDTVDVDALVSMNAWLLSPSIFRACRSIGPSERGEYELTSAVQYAIDHLGANFSTVRSNEGVLDLSSRADVESFSSFLNGKSRTS